MSLTRRFLRLTAITVMLSVCGFSVASLITLHYHVFADGLVVAHSHPIPDDNQRNTHKHSRQQCAELDAANQILDKLVSAQVLDLLLERHCYTNISFDPVSIPASVPAWHIFKRGPPTISSFC